MARCNSWFVTLLVVSSCVCFGCRKTGPAEHPASDASAEPILLHASGACLARIARLEEHNDLPSDGSHRIEAWLQVEESSGAIPEFLHLIIQHGDRAIEPLEELESHKKQMVLRHDSLKAGERHWFVFSQDYDAAKYPWNVAGWWRYRDGDVPGDVVDAVQNDRFRNHPVWDAKLNVVHEWQQTDGEFQVRVRKGNSLANSDVLFDMTLAGKLESLNLRHGAIPYEMEWPQGQEGNFVQIATIGELPAGNEFDLSPGSYRIMYAFELKTGKKVAVWVAKNQEIWLLHAFRQYNLETGTPTITMQFDLLNSGGIAAGGETEQWYRRTVKRFEAGELKSEQVFRHQYITTGTEGIYSGSGWLPVGKLVEQP